MRGPAAGEGVCRCPQWPCWLRGLLFQKEAKRQELGCQESGAGGWTPGPERGGHGGSRLLSLRGGMGG